MAQATSAVPSAPTTARASFWSILRVVADGLRGAALSVVMLLSIGRKPVFLSKIGSGLGNGMEHPRS